MLPVSLKRKLQAKWQARLSQEISVVLIRRKSTIPVLFSTDGYSTQYIQSQNYLGLVKIIHVTYTYTRDPSIITF
jgi:hypothetical protein